MGMIINGKWDSEDRSIGKMGDFVRNPSVYNNILPPEVIESIRNLEKRYILVTSYSCPWSHRVLLIRSLKNIETGLPVHIAGGVRIEGYGLLPDGPLAEVSRDGFKHLHQLYSLSDPNYSGRSTVPVIWDCKNKTIISNDSEKIMRSLNNVDKPHGFTFVPEKYLDEITSLNENIYSHLANAVYRAGNAQQQNAYDDAVNEVFGLLDEFEKTLSSHRYLLGNFVSEADLRLFVTLVRFDIVYATHFRCTRRRLVDYPNIWDYARDLYQWNNIADTVDFEAILEGYYCNDGSHNPHRIIAEKPQIDWLAPVNRDHLGQPKLWTWEKGQIDA